MNMHKQQHMSSSSSSAAQRKGTPTRQHQRQQRTKLPSWMHVRHTRSNFPPIEQAFASPPPTAKRKQQPQHTQQQGSASAAPAAATPPLVDEKEYTTSHAAAAAQALTRSRSDRQLQPSLRDTPKHHQVSDASRATTTTTAAAAAAATQQRQKKNTQRRIPAATKHHPADRQPTDHKQAEDDHAEELAAKLNTKEQEQEQERGSQDDNAGMDLTSLDLSAISIAQDEPFVDVYDTPFAAHPKDHHANITEQVHPHKDRTKRTLPLSSGQSPSPRLTSPHEADITHSHGGEPEDSEGSEDHETFFTNLSIDTLAHLNGTDFGLGKAGSLSPINGHLASTPGRHDGGRVMDSDAEDDEDRAARLAAEEAECERFFRERQWEQDLSPVKAVRATRLYDPVTQSFPLDEMQNARQQAKEDPQQQQQQQQQGCVHGAISTDTDGAGVGQAVTTKTAAFEPPLVPSMAFITQRCDSRLRRSHSSDACVEESASSIKTNGSTSSDGSSSSADESEDGNSQGASVHVQRVVAGPAMPLTSTEAAPSGGSSDTCHVGDGLVAISRGKENISQQSQVNPTHRGVEKEHSELVDDIIASGSPSPSKCRSPDTAVAAAAAVAETLKNGLTAKVGKQLLLSPPVRRSLLSQLSSSSLNAKANSDHIGGWHEQPNAVGHKYVTNVAIATAVSPKRAAVVSGAHPNRKEGHPQALTLHRPAEAKKEDGIGPELVVLAATNSGPDVAQLLTPRKKRRQLPSKNTPEKPRQHLGTVTPEQKPRRRSNTIGSSPSKSPAPLHPGKAAYLTPPSVGSKRRPQQHRDGSRMVTPSLMRNNLVGRGAENKSVRPMSGGKNGSARRSSRTSPVTIALRKGGISPMRPIRAKRRSKKVAVPARSNTRVTSGTAPKTSDVLLSVAPPEKTYIIRTRPKTPVLKAPRKATVRAPPIPLPDPLGSAASHSASVTATSLQSATSPAAHDSSVEMGSSEVQDDQGGASPAEFGGGVKTVDNIESSLQLEEKSKDEGIAVVSRGDGGAVAGPDREAVVCGVAEPSSIESEARSVAPASTRNMPGIDSDQDLAAESPGMVVHDSEENGSIVCSPSESDHASGHGINANPFNVPCSPIVRNTTDRREPHTELSSKGNEQDRGCTEHVGSSKLDFDGGASITKDTEMASPVVDPEDNAVSSSLPATEVKHTKVSPSGGFDVVDTLLHDVQLSVEAALLEEKIAPSPPLEALPLVSRTPHRVFSRSLSLSHSSPRRGGTLEESQEPASGAFAVAYDPLADTVLRRTQRDCGVSRSAAVTLSLSSADSEDGMSKLSERLPVRRLPVRRHVRFEEEEETDAQTVDDRVDGSSGGISMAMSPFPSVHRKQLGDQQEVFNNERVAQNQQIRDRVFVDDLRGECDVPDMADDASSLHSIALLGSPSPRTPRAQTRDNLLQRQLDFDETSVPVEDAAYRGVQSNIMKEPVTGVQRETSLPCVKPVELAKPSWTTDRQENAEQRDMRAGETSSLAPNENVTGAALPKQSVVLQPRPIVRVGSPIRKSRHPHDVASPSRPGSHGEDSRAGSVGNVSLRAGVKSAAVDAFAASPRISSVSLSQHTPGVDFARNIAGASEYAPFGASEWMPRPLRTPSWYDARSVTGSKPHCREQWGGAPPSMGDGDALLSLYDTPSTRHSNFWKRKYVERTLRLHALSLAPGAEPSVLHPISKVMSTWWPRLQAELMDAALRNTDYKSALPTYPPLTSSQYTDVYLRSCLFANSGSFLFQNPRQPPQKKQESDGLRGNGLRYTVSVADDGSVPTSSPLSEVLSAKRRARHVEALLSLCPVEDRQVGRMVGHAHVRRARESLERTWKSYCGMFDFAEAPVSVMEKPKRMGQEQQSGSDEGHNNKFLHVSAVPESKHPRKRRWSVSGAYTVV